jgi:hypothetical protein
MVAEKARLPEDETPNTEARDLDIDSSDSDCHDGEDPHIT